MIELKNEEFEILSLQNMVIKFQLNINNFRSKK